MFLIVHPAAVRDLLEALGRKGDNKGTGHPVSRANSPIQLSSLTSTSQARSWGKCPGGTKPVCTMTLRGQKP